MYREQADKTLKALKEQQVLDKLALRRPKQELDISVMPDFGLPPKLERSNPEDLTMRDLEEISRLDKISRNSIQGATGRILKAAKHDLITPEMREKFLEQEKQNQLDYYKSLKTGDPALLAKIPNVQVELEELPEKYDLMTDQNRTKLNHEINLIRQAIENLPEEERQSKEIVKKEMEAKIPQLLKEIEFRENREKRFGLKANVRLLKLELENALSEEPFKRVEQAIIQERERLSQELSRLGELREYDNLERNILEGEKRRIQKANEQKLKVMEEEYNTLNRGKFSIQRQPGESDEDYLQRMQDVGNSTIDIEGMDTDIARDIKNKLKLKLKEIIRDPGVIEAILREAESRIPEGEVTMYYDQVISLFPRIKQKIIEFFGENPSYRSVGSILDLIENILNHKEIKKVVDEEQFEKDLKKTKKEQPKKAEALYAPNEWLVDYFNEQRKGSGSYVKSIKQIKAILIAEAKAEGKPSSKVYDQWKANASTEYFHYMDLLMKHNEYESGQPAEEGYHSAGEGLKSLGKGLKSYAEQLPSLCEIGSIQIMPKKLYYKNILSIRSLKGNAFTGIKDCTVSDQMVKVILELCKGKIPSPQEIKHLSSSEKRIYDELIYMAKLHKEVSHSGEETIKQLKHRLSVLEGEIDAGNDNQEITKEIHKIINTLARMGALSHNNAREYLHETVGGLIKPRRKGKKSLLKRT